MNNKKNNEFIFTSWNFCKTNENDFLNYPSKLITKNFAKQLFHRLFLKDENNQSESDKKSQIEIKQSQRTESEHYNLQKVLNL